jgi:hypothetical protein
MLGRFVLVGLLTLLAVAVAGCGAAEPKEYGATDAGPTKVAKPLITDQPPPSDPVAEDVGPKVVATSAGLCKLYTTDEIGTWIGRSVRAGKAGTGSSYASCVWNGTGKATKAKGAPAVTTVVSITRGEASAYDAYRKQIVALAKSRSAGGSQVVRGVGDEAFAIGASVKGIPIWYGGTRHGDWMTIVEMSGGGTKAGVASVTEFLLDIIERG